MKAKRLTRDFFSENTIKVAQKLLGKYLVRKIGKKKIVGKIVETEAYRGQSDRASHVFRGKTPANEVMFGPPGYAYIFMIYGMHFCFNIVTEQEEYPAAVLIRALEPISGIKEKTNGPGRVCRALKIDKRLNGEDVIKSKKIYFVDKGEKISPSQIAVKPRVGVEYARKFAQKAWRFYLADNPFVSRK